MLGQGRRLSVTLVTGECEGPPRHRQIMHTAASRLEKSETVSSYPYRAMLIGQLFPVLLGGAQVITVSSAYPGLG